MIGEVNEDYVLEAGNNVVKPRFPWKGWAVACAVLALCAFPIWRMARTGHDLPQNAAAPLHGYTVMEGGGSVLTEQGKIEAPAGSGERAPVPAPSEAYVGGDAGQEGIDGAHYDNPGQDVAVQEEASAQYDRLLQNLGGENYPEWLAGAWLDNDQPDNTARLTVAIVDGFRTPELESQIRAWCGGTGEVLFQDAKYSHSYLDGLMEQVVELLDGTGLCCGIGVDAEANCLGVDLYSDQAIPDGILAELARLDPDGDAIRVRVFAGQTINTDIVKGPVPDPAEVSIAPGGARPIEDYEQAIPAETAQPATAKAGAE